MPEKRLQLYNYITYLLLTLLKNTHEPPSEPQALVKASVRA